MYKDFEDYKLWCKQNGLKEGRYESLRLYLDGRKQEYYNAHKNL